MICCWGVYTDQVDQDSGRPEWVESWCCLVWNGMPGFLFRSPRHVRADISLSTSVAQDQVWWTCVLTLWSFHNTLPTHVVDVPNCDTFRKLL